MGPSRQVQAPGSPSFFSSLCMCALGFAHLFTTSTYSSTRAMLLLLRMVRVIQKSWENSGCIAGNDTACRKNAVQQMTTAHGKSLLFSLKKLWTNSVSDIEGRLFVSQDDVVSSSAEAGVSLLMLSTSPAMLRQS